ncbi:hypothetical protein M1N04_00065 [Peptococcaceae bacterium]|nr:hypothetical protein [Peptococcaceae bacterium]
MKEHLPILIVLVPLFASLIVPILTFFSRTLARVTAITFTFITVICIVAALMHVLELGQPWSYHLAGWPPPWGIEYVFDPLSGLVSLLVAVFALAAMVYASSLVKNYSLIRFGMFHSLILLVLTGLLGMCITGDLFNFFVFMEISSVAAYALIAIEGRKSLVSAFRYLIIGTLAASFYLLGVGYIYAATGSLNMADVSTLISPLLDSPVIIFAMTMILVGLLIKSAMFPFHAWQPDVYSYAPPAVMGFIAAVMTKVSVYAIYRIFYFVIGVEGPVEALLEIMGWAAAVSILFGSAMALAQKDFRRMLAYSSVSQVSYVILGLAIGNAFALIGALLHMVAHAFAKGLLFLTADAFKSKMGSLKISDLIGVCRKMPITSLMFVFAAISMIGVPPLVGFFGKWYLLLGALEGGMWFFVIALIMSTLFTIGYSFRVVERVYELNKLYPELEYGLSVVKENKKEKEKFIAEVTADRKKIELPLTMLLTIVVLGMSLILLGVFNDFIVVNVIKHALPLGVALE